MRMRNFWGFFLTIGVIAAWLPIAVVRAAGPICYVKADATGTGSGTDWANAYTTLQDALADNACIEIWVAAGVYYPDEGAGQTNDDRTSTFQLKNGVALYGGFAGTEATRDQRDPARNITVLSGDIDQNDTTDAHGVVTDPANIHGNNAYHVVTGSGTDGSAVLDGFVITAGEAEGGDGGGMYNNGGSPTLRNLTFSGNMAAYDGGGLYNEAGNPTLTNVTFSDNSANRNGGGMYDAGGSPALTDVTFSGNSARFNGGGFFGLGDTPTLTNVVFADNTVQYAGGGMYTYYGNPVLIEVTFSGNSAEHGDGGGMFTFGSELTLTNVTFASNSARYGGGGMFNYNSSPTLTNVTFSGNSALYENGGGMYNYNYHNSSPTLTNVTFSGNSARDDGGGMFNYHSSPSLTNVTFSDNSASNGGGMFNGGNSSPTLLNVLIANSTSGGDCVNDSSSTIAADSASNLLEDNAHACGLTNGVNGDLIGLDPHLGPLTDLGGPGRQVHPLQAGSPAIDAGTNDGCPSTDQRGVARPQGKRCDIGAYEYGDETPPTVVSSTIRSAYVEGFTSFQVRFSEAVNDPPGNTNPNDVTNPANYLLVERGRNGTVDTLSCASGVQGDDIPIPVNSVTYEHPTFTATINLNNGEPLPDGRYRLFICGTTSITDLAGNPLNGGHDSIYDFTVGQLALPKTGFPRGMVIHLPPQPAAKAYTTTAMRLVIPALGLDLPIVGVPLTADGWDVSWLGEAAGWLEGSAFPTWNGNTVLTAHVWNANNTPGPFRHLRDLRYGDLIEIHAWGRVYVYEVRESLLLPDGEQVAIETILQHETYDVLTLITCEGYNPATGDYPFRRMVRAVLVAVH